LLEDHLHQLREEEHVTLSDVGDDNAAWQGWDLETDSSESSGDEGWMDVSSDDEQEFGISGSEDENSKLTGKGEGEKGKQGRGVANRVSTLATTKVRDMIGYSSHK
jgi:protein SDA1